MERDHRLPGRLDHPLAELDGLGQDDLLFGRQQGDLADLLEVHPNGIVDPDHVRRDGLEFLGRGLVDLLWVDLGRRVRGQLGGRAGHGAASDQDDLRLAVGDQLFVEIVVVIVVVVGDGDRGRA